MQIVASTKVFIYMILMYRYVNNTVLKAMHIIYFKLPFVISAVTTWSNEGFPVFGMLKQQI